MHSRNSSDLRPAAALIFLAVLGWVSLACGKEAPAPAPPTVEIFRYVDLIAAQRFRFAPDSGERVEVLCGGQTYESATWTTDERLEVAIPEGFDRARVRFCVPGPSASTVRVDFRLEGESTEGVHGGGDFGTGGWIELELETEEPAHRLVFEVVQGSPGPLYFSDLVVETRRRREPLLPDPPSSILLISLDTLRADTLGAYSNHSGDSNTPHLDAFAAESQVFDRHYASAHWTKPSHATMLTGLPNEVHGANDGNGSLAEEILTLAERFRAAGYRTGGVVRHIWLGEKFGFAQGFDDYRMVNWQTDQMRRSVANWLWDYRGEKTFFFWHVMEAHSDFRRLPYESRHTDQAWVEERFGVPDYGCGEGQCASFYLSALDGGRLKPAENESEILETLYQRGVGDLDRELGRLFSFLKAAGLWDSLTVVITSDHGEDFGRGGRFTHWGPAESVLQVPLIIKWPVDLQRTGWVEGPSASLDLAPTLLAEEGIEVRELPGTHLLHRSSRQPIIASSNDWTLVIQGSQKLIMGEGYPEPQLFDLSPSERYGENPSKELGEVKRLTSLRDHYLTDLQKQLNWEETTSRAALTEEEKEKLRALGYIAP